MSASRSDEGGSPGEGVMAVRGEASHKPSSPSPGRGAALDVDTKCFRGFGNPKRLNEYLAKSRFKGIPQDR